MMFDCSSIGNLLSLEVLSFANSSIECLPSTIGNLKKLRLLDLTDCASLHINNGVLKRLVKLEELYMRVDGRHGKAINLTYENCNEMAERSENLSALEFEFFQNDAQPKNMSFEKLQRFKISVGRYFDGDFSDGGNLYENTLQLVTKKVEVLESRLNDLFDKTEVLYLSVGDMSDIGDVEVKSSHPPQSSLFFNLRVLVVSECSELKHLFTLDVVHTLSKLEHLHVYECGNMEELVHTMGSGEDTITFPKLKFLSLCGLRKLSSLCHNINTIELPQLVELKLDGIPGFTGIYPQSKLESSCLLKEEVVIPKLEKLHIDDMENLKEIWPCEHNNGENVKLREIRVRNCDSLVNMFPNNPMCLLHHLQELRVEGCGSIEVLFNIDLDCVGEFGDGSSSSLRSIFVEELGKLREVWRIKGADKSHLICGFQAVESIAISNCKRFRNVFTPITTNFDLGGLLQIAINDRNNESAESSNEQEQISILLKEETSAVGDSNSHALYPSYLIHSFHNLRRLELWRHEGVEVVFEIESPTSRELVTTQHNQQPLLPYLEELYTFHMDTMSHVWKCNWNKFIPLQNKPSESPFGNLTIIHMYGCRSIKYLFSPLMAKLLSNLKIVKIEDCEGIEEVVSNKDDEGEETTTSIYPQADTTLFPSLDSLTLGKLNRLKYIGGGGAKLSNNELSFTNPTTTTASLDQLKFLQVGGVSWNLCQYSREIHIRECGALSSVIPCYVVGQMHKLQVLNIYSCHGMKEVFETQGLNNNSDCDEGTGGIPRLKNIIMLPHLNILEIIRCDTLEHIFTFSVLESLRQLEELTIKFCYGMKVIVKEEEDDGEQTTTLSKEVVVFPRLKSIALLNLPELVGFFLGMNEFRWPSLAKVTITDCPQMMVFSPGGSTTPKLKYIHTSLGKHTVECGLNFHVTTTPHHQTSFLSSYPTTLKGIPWSFHNLINLYVDRSTSMEKKIIPSNELLQLQKLEKVYVSWCYLVEEIFEALKGTTSHFDESQTVVKLPNIREVELCQLYRLRYIWKSNQWTVFQFPNLTRVDISSCNSLEHVFTSSMVGSLLQLQEVRIYDCHHMEQVIVKDTDLVAEKYDGKMNEITLPCLKSLILDGLRCLTGFCLRKEDFSLPLLNTLKIERCPAITIFTKGSVSTPELKEIETSFGAFYVGEDINAFIKIKQEEFKNDYDSY